MSLTNNRIQYYVEGECEKKLVKMLIRQKLIMPGQADVLNPVQEHIRITHLRKLPARTIIVLIFDTDTDNPDILRDNLQFLSGKTNAKRIITIPQVPNLEKELIHCTDIRRIRDLVNCGHDSDFKTAFIEEKRLYEKLQAHHFDLSKLWSSTPNEVFQKIGIRNQGEQIKLK